MTVYFIGNRKQGLVKIGHTDKSPLDRIKSLQTGCPFELEVLAYLPNDPFGSRRYEKILHRAFRKFRTQGEWFRITPDLVTLVEWHLSGTADLPAALVTRLRIAGAPKDMFELPEGEREIAHLLARAMFRMVQDGELEPDEESARQFLEDLS